MSIPFFTPFGKENAYFPRPGKSYPGKDVWPMETTPQKYQQYVRQKQKKSPLAKDLTLAFVIGGLICVIGQLIQDGYAAAGLEPEDAAAATSISLVFLSALLTGLNLYHRIARYGGAGTLVPITGFANAVVSPAIDFRAEGFEIGRASCRERV